VGTVTCRCVNDGKSECKTYNGLVVVCNVVHIPLDHASGWADEYPAARLPLWALACHTATTTAASVTGAVSVGVRVGSTSTLLGALCLVMVDTDQRGHCGGAGAGGNGVSRRGSRGGVEPPKGQQIHQLQLQLVPQVPQPQAQQHMLK
jgi:hypothetical protein